jgi:hypothetical protein
VFKAVQAKQSCHPVKHNWTRLVAQRSPQLPPAQRLPGPSILSPLLSTFCYYRSLSVFSLLKYGVSRRDCRPPVLISRRQCRLQLRDFVSALSNCCWSVACCHCSALDESYRLAGESNCSTGSEGASCLTRANVCVLLCWLYAPSHIGHQMFR